MAGNLQPSNAEGDKPGSGSACGCAAGVKSCGAADNASARQAESAGGKAAPSAQHAAPGMGCRLAAALEELWIAAFAWIPTPVGLALRLLAWRWLFKACGSARFSTGLSLAGCRTMRIGNGVRIGRGCFVTATDGELVLHDNVALSPNVHVGADAGRIEIGAHTAVGPGTVIRAANHCIARKDVPIMHQGHVPGQIVIEEDVWIGANCVITPDVRIGRGAVVGAGAVVTRNVAPFSIVGGVPAKLIGMRGQGNQPHWN